MPKGVYERKTHRKYKKRNRGTYYDDNADVMTVQEVAHLLRFHELTVLNHIKSGVIPAKQISKGLWRIWRPNLLQMLEQGGIKKWARRKK